MAEQNPNLVPSAPPAPAAAAGDSSGMLAKLEAVLARFEITIAEANDLVILQDYEMVVIADDSGSMQASAAAADQRVLGQPTRTRWQELGDTVSEIVEIASCFDESGVDVFFLNRQPLLGVKSAKEPLFVQTFQQLPYGRTPLTEQLQQVAQRFSQTEKKILLFILTDGEPNGGKDAFIRAVRQVVAGGRAKIQIMACTAEEDEIGWLNVLDAQLAEVDVTDDYFSEKAEVLKVGLATRFTRGDWCMKAMLGPVSRKFDAWDEKCGKVTAKEVQIGQTECTCAMM